MKRAFGIFLLAILLIACGDPPPSTGYVRDHKFDAAHWESGYRTKSYTDTECNIQLRGNEYRYVCEPVTKTRSVYESHHEYVDDRWFLFLEDCQIKDGKNKCNQGWLQVDETTYHHFNVGQHYPDPK